jgi:hypothetical protein
VTRNGRRDYSAPWHRGIQRETLQPVITIHSTVIDRAIAEVRENPSIEVGGKFVGYVQGGFSASEDDWQAAFNQLRITILGNLDPGPGRDRSAVHHLSDTDYQLRLFQRVATEFPALRFLGLWHSHHPNGLRELSSGDDQTGRRTVNSDGHELDLLLSSLVIDSAGLLGGRHFVFLRGHERFYEIDGRCLEVTEGPNPVAATIERNARWLYSAQAAQHRRPGAEGPSRPPRPAPSAPSAPSAPFAPSAPSARPARSAQGGERSRAETERAATPTSWLQSSDGREALAFDSGWLRSYPSLRPATRDGGIVWLGPVDAGPVAVSCAYYRPGQPGGTPVAEFSGDDGAVSLRVSLADEASRAARFAACLAALAALASPPEAQSAGSAGTSRTVAADRDGAEVVPDDPVPPPEPIGPAQQDQTSSGCDPHSVPT